MPSCQNVSCGRDVVTIHPELGLEIVNGRVKTIERRKSVADDRCKYDFAVGCYQEPRKCGHEGVETCGHYQDVKLIGARR